MITPREMLRDYMTVMNILMQNPSLAFEDIVGEAVTLATDTEENAPQPAKETREKQNYTPEDIVF